MRSVTKWSNSGATTSAQLMDHRCRFGMMAVRILDIDLTMNQNGSIFAAGQPRVHFH